MVVEGRGIDLGNVGNAAYFYCHSEKGRAREGEEGERGGKEGEENKDTPVPEILQPVVCSSVSIHVWS